MWSWMSSRQRTSLTSRHLELWKGTNERDGETVETMMQIQGVFPYPRRSPWSPPSSLFFSSSMAFIFASCTSARALHSPLLIFSPSNMGLISAWKRANSCQTQKQTYSDTHSTRGFVWENIIEYTHKICFYAKYVFVVHLAIPYTRRSKQSQWNRTASWEAQRRGFCPSWAEGKQKRGSSLVSWLDDNITMQISFQKNIF